MPRFMATHTFPANAFTVEQCRQLGQAGQQDPVVHGEHSFINLSQGKAVCVVDAPSREALAQWFQKVGMPYDTITEVEIEGERGKMNELSAQATAR